MSPAAALGLALLTVLGVVGLLLGVVGVLRLRAQRQAVAPVRVARPASAPAVPVVADPDPLPPPAAPPPDVVRAPGPVPPVLRPDPVQAPAPRPAALEAELRALLVAGRKIEAVKRAREATGLGLKEAKDLVEGIEAGGSIAAAGEAPRGAGGVEAELRALLAAGRKIDAIKRAREATGLGLKEAKDLVEQLEDGGAWAPPAAEPHAALEAELRALLAQDRAPEAILLLHRRLGLGVGEAKAAVEALRAGATLAALGR
jgi:ribosomal protein L7/L12